MPETLMYYCPFIEKRNRMGAEKELGVGCRKCRLWKLNSHLLFSTVGNAREGRAKDGL
jgi:hypothetical protein